MQSVPLSPVPSEKLLGPGHGPSVWPLRERLALASALLDVDNQQLSWPGISRQLSRFSTPDRPESWCSARACAKQYALLLDAVELTRRQKTPAELSRMHIIHAAPSPSSQSTTSGLSVAERLVKRLTVERVDELRHRIRLGQKYYSFLKQFLTELESGKLDSHVPKLENVIGLRAISPTQRAGNDAHTVETSDDRPTDSRSSCEAAKLVEDFTQMWHEIDSVYKVPESTWICPPGLGTAASTAGSGQNVPKPTGTGSVSLNRLNTLLAEASSVMQTPVRNKTSHERGGRRSFVGLHLGLNTATTRAAVAARQRYIANATKKQRMALRTKAKRKFGRSRKGSIASLLRHSKASDKRISDPQQSGSSSHQGNSGDETTDEYRSSDTTYTRHRLSESGASTPSTTAMCLSDIDELIAIDVVEQSVASADRLEEVASTNEGDGTSPGTVSSEHGRTMSTDEGSDLLPIADVEDEPETPAMSASPPSSQATEAAGHQDQEEAEGSEGEPSDTLVAQSPTVTANEIEEYLHGDLSACATVTSRVSDEEQANDFVQSLTESKLIQSTTSEDLAQSLARSNSEEPSELFLPPGATTENDVTIMTSTTVLSDTNERSLSKHSAEHSPEIYNGLPTHSIQSVSVQLISNEAEPSVRTCTTEINPHVLLDSTGLLPPDDINQTGSHISCDGSDKQVEDSHVEKLSCGAQSSVLQMCSNEQSLLSNSNQKVSSPHMSFEDAKPVHLKSPFCSTLSDTSAIGSPKPPNHESGQWDVLHDVTLSSPLDHTHTTGLISESSFSPKDRRESLPLDTPTIYRDVYHMPSSSTPSGKELTIELSPANLSQLAACNSCVLLESNSFMAPPSQKDNDQWKKSSGYKPRSKSRSKSTKKNRRGKHRPKPPGEYGSQLLSPSKGSPVVELSNLMLSMPSSPDSAKPDNMSLNLHATVSLEPIILPCSSEYIRQDSCGDRSSPPQATLSSSHHDTSAAQPSIRIRLCRHGSQLTVVSGSHPLPHSDWTSVFDADDESIASWCHKVLSTAETALYNLCNNFRDQLHSERHYSTHSIERGRVAVQSVLDSIRLAVDNRQIVDQRSLTHRLLDCFARLVMTHSSTSTTCRLTEHVYKRIEQMLSNYGADMHTGDASATATQEKTDSPTPEPTPKRARKKKRFS